jgi:putative ABC transport system permease protein
VVLGHALWQRRFGSDPKVIGQTITLQGNSYTVIGVMPAGFVFNQRLGGPVDCWIRLDTEGDMTRRLRAAAVVARLRRGIGIKQAQTEMDGIARRLQEAFPENKGWGIALVPLYQVVTGDVDREVLVLAGAVVFVLLIACANVANLLMTRGANRSRELAVRSALGAGKARLIRQLLTESVLLSVLGGLLGLLLAAWGLRGLIALSPPNLPGLEAIAIDKTVFGFLVAVALLTGIVCGIAPAFQGSKTNLAVGLKETGFISAGTQRRRLSRLLVVSEVALALMLLIGAGLLMNSFIRLQSIPIGFNPKNVLTVRVTPGGNPYQVRGVYVNKAVQQFHLQLLERVERLPGTDAAAIGPIPLSGGMPIKIYVEGRQERVDVKIDSVSPNYFRVLGIPMIAGRTFTEQDVPRRYPSVAVVNRMTAQKTWPGENPIGKRISFSAPKNPAETEWATIIGMIEDARIRGLEGPPELGIYTPFPQHPGLLGGSLLVRTKGEPLDMAAQVKEAVKAIDKDQPITRIETLEQVLSQSGVPRRFNLLLIGIFAVIAIVLAGVGIYGVIAHAVSSRTNEVGIRMALGAEKTDILRLFLKQSLWMILIGQMLGLAGAFALNRVMAKMVFGITTTDVATYVGVCMFWTAVGLLASYLPARRATKVDAMVALRCE